MRTLVPGGWSRPAQASGSWWAAWPVPIMAAAVAIVLGVPAIGPWGASAMVGGGLVLGLVVARYVLSAVSVTASDDVVCRTVGLNHRVNGVLSRHRQPGGRTTRARHPGTERYRARMGTPTVRPPRTCTFGSPRRRGEGSSAPFGRTGRGVDPPDRVRTGPERRRSPRSRAPRSRGSSDEAGSAVGSSWLRSWRSGQGFLRC